jgi:hypothetical protein
MAMNSLFGLLYFYDQTILPKNKIKRSANAE